MTQTTHDYTARLIWDGNTGEGTAGYTSYGRQYRALVAGKPDLAGSADPAFLGEPDKHHPEDLFLISIAACHMLFYLALCARQGVRVLDYRDEVQGTLRIEPGGGGRFDEILLRPVVTIDDATNLPLAATLHDTAHERCFIANSCRAVIRHRATVRAVASPSAGASGRVEP